VLYRFVIDEALPGSAVDPDTFWAGADMLVHEFAPRSRQLVARRAELQAAIDGYHRQTPGVPADPALDEERRTSANLSRRPPRLPCTPCTTTRSTSHSASVNSLAGTEPNAATC